MKWQYNIKKRRNKTHTKTTLQLKKNNITLLNYITKHKTIFYTQNNNITWYDIKLKHKQYYCNIVTLQYNIKRHKIMLGKTDNIVIIQNNIIRHKISL